MRKKVPFGSTSASSPGPTSTYVMPRSLQRNPTHLYFSSLTSLVQALANYDQCRWIPEHVDYARLKQRARHKATLEKVTKTLLVKGIMLLVDLTDEVCKVGEHPVCHGGFSDVWKGIWTNTVGSRRRCVSRRLGGSGAECALG